MTLETLDSLAADARRYRKLREWMSSNVPEGWSVVENLGAVAAWVGYEAFDKYLDDLPKCLFGMCATPVSAAPPIEPRTATAAAESTYGTEQCTCDQCTGVNYDDKTN